MDTDEVNSPPNSDRNNEHSDILLLASSPENVEENTSDADDAQM